MVVTRFTVFQTRGGQIVDEIEPSEFDWEEQSNTPETVKMTFVERVADWFNLFTPWKHSIAVEIGGRCLGGPIIPSDLDGDKNTLQVTARGLRYMLDRVPILPAIALTRELAPGGVPDPTLDTTISGVDLGTIGKKLIQQARTWPGWSDIPIRFHADRPGSRSRTYAAVDRKRVEDALGDLESVQNGPDIRLRLERTGPDSFGWVYESGTEEQPRLQGQLPIGWEPDDLTGLGIQRDPSRMGSISWTQGGRSDDTTLIRMRYDPYLVERGFPLLHLESGGSSSISDPATADSWNVETLRTARSPWEFWRFAVSADQEPYPYEYGCGDLADLYLSPAIRYRAGLLSGEDTLSGPGVLSGPFSEETVPSYLQARTYTRRIVGISGSSGSDRITITCGEAYDA